MAMSFDPSGGCGQAVPYSYDKNESRVSFQDISPETIAEFDEKLVIKDFCNIFPRNFPFEVKQIVMEYLINVERLSFDNEFHAFWPISVIEETISFSLI